MPQYGQCMKSELKTMYAKESRKRTVVRRIPTTYLCQVCGETFNSCINCPDCNFCFSTGKSNLIVLYMENDFERAEWLDLVDFSAG